MPDRARLADRARRSMWQRAWRRPQPIQLASHNQGKLDNSRRIRQTDDMHLGVERALNLIPVGGIVRCARSIYELLGNRRKSARLPTSGNIFVTFQGLVADTTYGCLCVDVSPKGIAIDSVEPMTVDATVQLHTGVHGARRLAAVRYCLERNGSYRVGLEFISDAEMAALRASVARTQAGKRGSTATG
jgi:hypothetical protein